MAELTRLYVSLAFADAARAAQLPVSTVLGSSNDPTAVAARYSALRMILEETGCTRKALARVSGCSLRSIYRAAGSRKRPVAPDPWKVLRENLRWRYGAARTVRILAGRDPATNADLATWEALGEPKEGHAA